MVLIAQLVFPASAMRRPCFVFEGAIAACVLSAVVWGSV